MKPRVMNPPSDAMRRRILSTFAASLIACGSPASRGAAPVPTTVPARAAPAGEAAGYDDWYPDDITPPAGTQYPCALTALPRDLPGVPAADRQFVNHVYSMVLKATQAKLELLHALKDTDGLQVPLDRYLEATQEARDRIVAEPVPAGLEEFTGDVLEALDKQRSFFRAAVASRARGVSWNELFQHPDGRAASRRLISAWSRMTQRYPQWSPALRDSVYHHLCALDLF